MAVWSVTVILGLTCVWVSPSWTAPVKTYDQRQQGDLNIHAQLDNIVVLVIPSARLNLLELAMDTKVSGEKGGFLQLLQKLNKANIDRYETVKEEDELQAEPATGEFEIDIRKPIPVITTVQHISLNHEDKIGDKEEEVVATVQEMKPDLTVKATDVPKQAEDSTVQKQSSNGEVIQETVVNTAVPVQEENIKKDKENKSKEQSQTHNDTDKQTKPFILQDLNKKSSNELEKLQKDKSESSEKETLKSSKPDIDKSTKETASKTTSVEFQEDRKTIEDYIKPIAAKEEITPASSASKKTQPSEEHQPKKSVEPVRLQEGVRKEKVIRYKPEAKWAPELVDLLGPPRPKPKDLQERHMFADLCSPGAWDSELRTCIMPGETRSRGELARFLNAMRFGIAIPK